jgi:hypothetical protein
MEVPTIGITGKEKERKKGHSDFSRDDAFAANFNAETSRLRK